LTGIDATVVHAAPLSKVINLALDHGVRDRLES
jgi:hypothetical protein